MMDQQPQQNNTGLEEQTILILTPIKDAATYVDSYFKGLQGLTYDKRLMSIGILESDSTDASYEIYSRACNANSSQFRRIQLFKKDFGFRIPENIPRWEPMMQYRRRVILARSRNHLLFRALDDEDWVLWLDVDIAQYPQDVIERLLSFKKDILHPHCVKTVGGASFDHNAWRDHGRLHMQDMRNTNELVPLDAVGGTMLLVKADCHRDGLIFPPFLYGKRNPKVRERSDIFMPGEEGELETEGLGILASDMCMQCWGLPHLEIIHTDS